ncbi:hypothetical protein NL676_012211 [Syzygium grande]|nr:hypothetical protein NL676_012211 [Syzygium grande]
MLASTAGVGGSGSGEGTEGTSPAIEMSQAEQEKLWWQASAAVKKGKVYGLGSLARDSMKSVGTSSAGTSSRRSARESELEKKVENLENLLAEKDEKMKKMEERLDAIDARDEAMRIMQQQLSMLMRQQRWSRFAASKTMRMKSRKQTGLPPHPPPDEDHEE